MVLSPRPRIAAPHRPRQRGRVRPTRPTPRLRVTLLSAIRGDARKEAPVFVSRKGSPLSTSQAFRIVRAAARRAGVDKDVSPHWMRHAHASHALDRGAAVHLVQATLGHSSVATTGRYLHARPTESSSKYLAV